MNIEWRTILMFPLLALVTSCGVLSPATPTALPGWRSSVSELFVDDSVFPEGWRTDFPEDTVTDPTINHIGRSWGRRGISGTVTQAIWRAYTVADAQRKYNELRTSQFHPKRTLPPYELFLEFEPPDEIDFQSQVADEFYLACGWWTSAYCEVVARYHNYVVDIRLDLEAEYAGHTSHGLTYAEIETVVTAMDTKFAEAMAQFYPSPP